MAIEDKTKWDKKYNETPSLLQDRDASEKLQKFVKKTEHKKALEIACGTGRNSIFLAQSGYEVDALDISKVALEFLNSKDYKNIHTMLIDLDNYIPPKDTYDLVVMTNFLDRAIIPHLKNSLKIDGLLIIETYMEDNDNDKKPSKPEYLLKENELKEYVDEYFELIEYDEYFNEKYEIYRMKKQSICLKRSK